MHSSSNLFQVTKGYEYGGSGDEVEGEIVWTLADTDMKRRSVELDKIISKIN